MRLPRNLPCTLACGFTLITAVVAAGHPSSAHAFDHVVNGDFENGATGWSASPNVAFDVVPVTSIDPTGSGSMAALTLQASTFNLQQKSLGGTVAGTYLFSARIRLSTGMTSVILQGSVEPQITAFTFDVPQVAGEWLDIGGSVPVTGYTNVTFTIWGTGSPGAVVYVDDVRFEGADPATMTPTYTPVPATATVTPLPPTATKTTKPTHTPKPNATTEAPAEVSTVERSSWARGFERVVNGGFEDVGEDGALTAWEKYGGSMSVSTTAAHGGRQTARLESTTDSTKWLFQTVGVTGGGTYAFDAWLLHDDPGVASALLRVSWYASTDGSGSALGTADSTARLEAAGSEWRYLTTGGVAAPGEAQSARVRVLLQPVSDAPAAMYVDDASFGPAVLAPVADEGMDDGAVGEISTNRAVAGTSRRPASERAIADSGRGAAGAPMNAQVVINEVLYDSIGAGNDANGEWVELHNPGDSPVSLEGWALADATSADVLDAVTIPGRGFIVIAASEEFLVRYPDFNGELLVLDGRVGNGLGNEGEVLVLVEPSGRFVDAVSWGDNTDALKPSIDDAPAGHSIERLVSGTDSNRADDFVDNGAPSPGRGYDANAGPLGRRSDGTNSIEVLRGESEFSLSWLPWLLGAASMAVLAGVASWRLLPPLAGRLRHQ
jgi:hypothetical protein